MTSTPPGPRPPLRVGIVGTGWGARTQAPLFRRAGLELVGFWGRTAERARQACRTHGAGFATDDWSELVRHPEVDLVSIVTPPHTHREIAIAALAAGKHVLCEKPTALDAAEAEAMAERARAAPGLLALIDHELRFFPPLRRMAELLREGAIGEPWVVDGEFLGGGRLDPDWAWGWWSDAGRGGGILGAAGSHFLDTLQWLTARRVVGLRALFGRGLARRADPHGVERPVTSDDWAGLLIELEGGLPGSLRLSALDGGPARHRFAVSGSRGRLEVSDGRLQLRDARTRAIEDLTPGDELGLPQGMPDNPWTRGTAHLAAALSRWAEGDRKALAAAADFETGLGVQRLLDAARAAANVPASL